MAARRFGIAAIAGCSFAGQSAEGPVLRSVRVSKAAIKWLSDHRQESITRLVDWLKIPSISTDPKHADDYLNVDADGYDRPRAT